MNNFFPENYEVPDPPSKYMKFDKGENRFRLLSNPVMGWEWWVHPNGEVLSRNEKRSEGDKPVRVPFGPITQDQLDDPEAAVHFWAVVVWNYQTKSVQILVIRQRRIQKAITALYRSKDWGDPVQRYDITVTKTGEGLDTKYDFVPSPPTPMDEGVVQFYKDLQINLKALFDDKDPFGDNTKAATPKEEKVEVPF